MHEDLKKFMLRLATDLELLNRFVADARKTAEEEGLTEAAREVLFSGDQNRIYFAIGGKQRPAPAPPQQAQPAQPASGAWAFTPSGWQWVAR